MDFQQSLHFIQSELHTIYSASEIQYITKILLEKIASLPYTQIVVSKNDIIDNPTLLQYVAELKTQKPLQYVLGECYFYGNLFKVNEHTLIPRPETALLIDTIIQLYQTFKFERILDIGTGSGCIAICIKKYIPTTQVDALDISSPALAVAQHNATVLQQNIHFFEADIFNYMPPNNTYDIMVSNPPYVSEADKPIMQPQVVNFEPHIALFVPADDMLLYYQRITQCAVKGLKKNGYLIVEIESTMCEKAMQLLQPYFKEISCLQDENLLDRVLICKK